MKRVAQIAVLVGFFVQAVAGCSGTHSPAGSVGEAGSAGLRAAGATGAGAGALGLGGEAMAGAPATGGSSTTAGGASGAGNGGQAGQLGGASGLAGSASGSAGSAGGHALVPPPFEPLATGSSDDYRAVWVGDDDSVWVGGAALCGHDAKGWRESESVDDPDVPIDSLWGRGLRPSFAAAGNRIFTFANSAWSPAVRMAACSTCIRLSVADDTVYAGCPYSGAVARFPLAQPSQGELGYGAAFASNWIWAYAGGEAFSLFAARHQFLHYTGGDFGSLAAWAIEPLPAFSASYTMGMWSDEHGQFVVVGADGLILRRRAGVWSRVASGTHQALHAVWGAAGEGIYVVGDQGTLLFDGGDGFRPLVAPRKADFTAVHGHAGGTIAIAGSAGTLLVTKR